jgi:hypothetical protein
LGNPNFFTIDRGFEDSDFPPDHVVVRMVRAKPGTICITFFNGRIGASMGSVTATTRTAKVAARIDVSAGTAIYAGSLVLDKEHRLSVLDKQKRDLTRVKAGNLGRPGPVCRTPGDRLGGAPALRRPGAVGSRARGLATEGLNTDGDT